MRRTTALLSSALLVAYGFVECDGSQSSPESPADAGLDAAAVDGATEASSSFDEARAAASYVALQTKVCTAFQRCDPTDFARQFATVEDCSRIESPIVVTSAGNYGYYREAGALANQYAYGTTLTAASVDACTAALDFSSCTTFARFINENAGPPACSGLFRGTLPVGAPCWNWNQCASGRCITSPKATFNGCGSCVEPAEIGQPCDLACPDGAFCQPKTQGSSDFVCKKLGDVGVGCDGATWCHFDLVCENHVCKTPLPDDACDPDVPANLLAPWLGQAGCPIFPGARYCEDSTGKCTPMPLADAGGEPCGLVDGGAVFTGCVAGLACTAVLGDASPREYRCAPLIPQGGECFPGDFTFEVRKCETGVCFQLKCQELGPSECSAPPVTP